jgi:hypothetical protein
MTPTVTNEVRIAAVRSLLIEAENQIRQANKILNYMMDLKDADQVVNQVQECED